MSDVVTSLANHKTSEATSENASLRRNAVVALLVAAGYYFTAKIGFAFALNPGSVSTLWMPNSILLAGLLLLQRRYWWIIILAALPAHFASEIQSGVPTAMILSWFISNSFQALFGAFFICKFVDDGMRFDKLRDLTIFLVFCTFLIFLSRRRPGETKRLGNQLILGNLARPLSFKHPGHDHFGTGNYYLGH